jgi:hypothetical protein
LSPKNFSGCCPVLCLFPSALLKSWAQHSSGSQQTSRTGSLSFLACKMGQQLQCPIEPLHPGPGIQQAVNCT